MHVKYLTDNKDCFQSHCRLKNKLVQYEDNTEDIRYRQKKSEAINAFVLPDLTYLFGNISSLNEDLEAIFVT